VLVAGRRAELAEVGRLLDGASRGSGGLLIISGPAGSGKTLIAESAAAAARDRGFEVLWARPADGQPGRLAWARLLRDAGAPDGLVAGLIDGDAGPLDLDAAAAHLVSGTPRLIVIDDVDRGGPDAAAMLRVVASRCQHSPVAVLATCASPPGLEPDLRLGGLTEAELAEALGDLDPETCHALWLASRGLPGVARRLARALADRADGADPVVRLALESTASTLFLAVDTNLVRLLETAASRARDDATRARVLARLARELLGDASAAARRRALVGEALRLARRTGDPRALADVLDARLHALWDQRGAEDRLAAGSEIIDLARVTGDGERERQGMFWRFVALMELGRVDEAESALAAFAHDAAAAGDADATVLATARHAMLAILRGRFDQALRLIEEVEREGRRLGRPDAEAITMTLMGTVALEQGGFGELGAPGKEWWERAPDLVLANAHERPGHLLEATAARLLLAHGRAEEAAAELDRSLTRALASSGPRWLGAMADLAVVAAGTGDTRAAARLYEAMLPYRGRLVVLGGAAATWGPVSHYLGELAATTGQTADAVRHFEDAIEFEERIGALPYLAHSLAGMGGALTRSGDAARAAGCLTRARGIARRLGMTVLLGRLGAPASEWSLVRDGEDWLLTAGEERARLRDGRGLHYLRALLAAPGREVRALDLAAGGAGLAPAGAGPVLDAAARGAYRRRLGEVTAALAAADRAGDEAAAARAEAERAALLRELRGAVGLSGRVRDAAPEAERARVNVTRTLRAAIERIADGAPGAAAHLRASVRTGASCRYAPAPGGPDRWLV
jgi:tetratricopeptide (TPR) repeat protein